MVQLGGGSPIVIIVILIIMKLRGGNPLTPPLLGATGVKTVNSRTLTDLKNEWIKENVYTKLDSNLHVDPTNNFEIFMNTLNRAKNKHIPKKSRKFNKRTDKKKNGWQMSYCR